MNIDINSVLGIPKFKSDKDIISFLTKEYPSQDFSNNTFIRLERNKYISIVIVTSHINVFIVRDNGFQLTVILNRNKSSFNCKILKLEKPLLYIENTTTLLPINTTYTGSLQILENTLDNMKTQTIHIELQDWHTKCGDGCCDEYGTDVYLNGELLETTHEDGSKTDVDGESVTDTVMTVLKKLGYNVEIERTWKD